MTHEYAALCSPFSIGAVTVKNRFVMAPVTTGSYLGAHGEFSSEGIDYFVRRAEGGFGLLQSGALNVDYDVDPVSALGPDIISGAAWVRESGRRLNARIEPLGASMFLQITMGLGRNYPGLYAPSELPVYDAPGIMSKALAVEQIARKVDHMVEGARVAQEAGFAGVEVHAMHWGYLLDQFAMAITNQRTDEYGGTLENRLRCAREIVEGIKQTCGRDFPVTMRLGLKSYLRGLGKASFDGSGEVGRTVEEGVRICELLQSYGYDALDVDTGTYDSFYWACPPSFIERGYMVELAAEAKRAVSIPIICGSRMGDPAVAEKAIEEGMIDAVALGRPSIADPDLPRKVEEGHSRRIRPCISCNQGCFHQLMAMGKPAGCAVNPEMGHDASYRLRPAVARRHIVVVGGGVAGMEAARTCALRGHDVTLFERDTQLGGHLIAAAKLGFERELGELNAWYQTELAALGVDVRLGQEADDQTIAALGSDAVVLAVGSRSTMPAIPGVEGAITCVDALMDEALVGDRVIIVGNGFVDGASLALQLVREGKHVTLVQEPDELFLGFLGVPVPNERYLRDAFEYYGVDVHTGCQEISVTDAGVRVVLVAGEVAVQIDADTVIVAETFEPVTSMAGQLAEMGVEVHEVGDGAQVGNVLSAIGSAYGIARVL